MKSRKSPVPGLSRGIQILRFLAIPRTVETIVRQTHVPKSSVQRILQTLRDEGLAVRSSDGRTFQATMSLVHNGTAVQMYLVPGDSTWSKSSEDFFNIFPRGEEGYISTYAQRGDADTGIMWRWLPRDGKQHHITFRVHGGHAQVLLIEGEGDIAPANGDIVALQRDLVAGAFGRVVAVAQGRDSNDTEIPVNWDLTRYDTANLKVAIIDALNEPWGFITVSQMTLSRY